MDEVLRSYALIFASTERARKRYTEKEREKAKVARGGFEDSVLDRVCGYKTLSVSDTQQEYDLKKDFPLIGSRLLVLQNLMIKREPNTWTKLWQDRRDIHRWGTFWLVAVFGCSGVILAAIQVVLSCLQVSAAYESMRLQKSSGE
jgi:hypothetical protein